MYYINMLMTPFSTIFRRFPTTFWRFQEIFQNCSEGQINVSKYFPNYSERFPKMPKTTEEDPKMFRSYTSKFKCSWRDKGEMLSNMISHMCDIVFINLLPLNTPLTFITIHYSNHHLFHFHQQEVSQGQLTGTRHKL